MSEPAPSPDTRLAQALAAAEKRLAMLERLAEMGMAIAGEITERIVEFPSRAGSGPEARAFANVSRAVRLTLMLAAKVEKSILALRKGGLGLELEAARKMEAASAEAAKMARESKGERLRAAVIPAIEREAADAEDAENLLRRVDRRLSEREEFGAFLARPFRECIEAICQDLGLDPEPILALEDGDADEPISGGSTPPSTHRAQRDPSAGPGELALARVDGIPGLIRDDPPKRRGDGRQPHPREYSP